MKNEELFQTGSVWKAIFSMAVPSIVIVLVMVLYNMADMFFVGQLGDMAQVAAVSVVGPVFSILAAVATMLGAGGSAIIARCFGAGEIEQGRTCASLCFWTGIGLGIVTAILLILGRKPLLDVLGATSEIMPYAERYLVILAAGAPFLILANSMAMLVRAEGAVDARESDPGSPVYSGMEPWRWWSGGGKCIGKCSSHSLVSGICCPAGECLDAAAASSSSKAAGSRECHCSGTSQWYQQSIGGLCILLQQ